MTQRTSLDRFIWRLQWRACDRTIRVSRYPGPIGVLRAMRIEARLRKGT